MSESSLTQFIQRTLRQWPPSPDNLLQILIVVQRTFNHIPVEAQVMIADQLQNSQSEIQRNIDFYGFLHQQPRGRYDILFSDNIIDQMQDSRQLCEQFAHQLGMEVGSTRADEQLSLDYTSCTGMSDQSPAALINGLALPHLQPDQILQMAQLIEASVPVHQWPQAWFEVHHNIQRKDLLLEHEPVPGTAIEKLLKTGSDLILQELEKSGLRGRGGAGFSSVAKWRLCRDADASEKIVVCNADEGEPGTFKDRVLLQEYAHGVIEGMTLCASVTGASKGFIYLRGEYEYLLPKLKQVLQMRRQENLLGESILGRNGFDFDISILLGAGAYICGEESALIESMEGKPGIPRLRPPFPVTHGYQGLPTVVNNVETLLAAAVIVDQGADKFIALGTSDSPGTKVLSISGDCSLPGIYEYPFGVSLDQILLDCGAEDTQLVQIAGAAGQCVTPSEFQRCIAFEDLATAGSFMIFDQSRDVLKIVQNFIRFFRHESCGFCSPCRVGTSLLQKHLDKIMDGHGSMSDLNTIRQIGLLMRNTSHCGLGQTAPNPLLYSLEKLPSAYQDKLKYLSDDPGFDLHSELQRGHSNESASNY